MIGNKDNTQKTFNSPTLKIAKNGIDCQDTFIHIKNITQMWIGEVPKKPLPVLYVIIFWGVGLYMFTMNLLIALIFLGITAAILFVHFSQVTYYGINIEMASGKLYSFTSKSKDYLTKAYECIKSLINEQGNFAYNINLNTGDIKSYEISNANLIMNSSVGGSVIKEG